MNDFTIHTTESAPAGSIEILTEAKRKFGMIPNLLGILAEAPSALKAYLSVAKNFEQSSLNPIEQQIVLLTASFENGCPYCMAAHSAIAKMQKMPASVLEALRKGKPIEDSRLEALRKLTQSIVQNRGWLADQDLKAFLLAGYSKAQVLEVLIGVAQKTISNYTNHLADTPVDQVFKEYTWIHPKATESKEIPV